MNDICLASELKAKILILVRISKTKIEFLPPRVRKALNHNV